jgi:hypothetical protein
MALKEMAAMVLLVALLVGGQAPANYDCNCFCGEPTDNAAEPTTKEDYTCECDCEDVVANARAAATAASGFKATAEAAAAGTETPVSAASGKVAEANAAIAALTAAEHSANLDAKYAAFRDGPDGYAAKLASASGNKTAAVAAKDAAVAAHATADAAAALAESKSSDAQAAVTAGLPGFQAGADVLGAEARAAATGAAPARDQAESQKDWAVSGFFQVFLQSRRNAQFLANIT